MTIEELRAEFDSLVQASLGTDIIVSAIPWGQPAQNLSLTWDPTHDSVQLTLGDAVNAAPLLVSNHNYKDPNSASNKILAIAGTSLAGQGGRMAAFGGNPLANIWAGNQNGTGFDMAMINTVRWLLGQESSATPISALTPRIVTAHLPGVSSYWYENPISGLWQEWCAMSFSKSSFYTINYLSTSRTRVGAHTHKTKMLTRFPHDTQTTNWLTSRFPSANVSDINTCDNFALPGCLVDADLLIIGRQIGNSDDTATNSAATNATAVTDAVEAFARRGKPVMYVHYSRTATELTTALFKRILGLGAQVANNYWIQAGLLNMTRSQAAATETSIVALKRAIDSVFDGTSNASGVALTEAEYLPCFASVNTWWSAPCTAGFDYKVRDALKALRTYLMGVDENAVDLFPVDDPQGLYTPREMRVAVLLGDKARERIAYPFNRTDQFAFVNAMFGDAAVLYRRSRGPPQADLGTLHCPERFVMDLALPHPDTCIALGYGKYAHLWGIPSRSVYQIDRKCASGVQCHCPTSHRHRLP